MSKNGRLSPRKRRFIAALLTEKDTRAAAEVAGIAERTAYRWLKLEEVQAALVKAESAALRTITRGLVRLASQAIETLEGAMSNDEARMSTQIRAADIILSRLMSLREMVDIEERLTALEEASYE